MGREHSSEERKKKKEVEGQRVIKQHRENLALLQLEERGRRSD